MSTGSEYYKYQCNHHKCNCAYIDFDIKDIRVFKQGYCYTMDLLLEELGDVNVNSRIEIKDFFWSEYRIELDSLQIKHLKEVLVKEQQQFYPNQGQERLEALIEYLKLKYTIKNYFDCILRHEVKGRVYLREVDGELRMPNKQPLSFLSDIKRAIKATKGV